MPKTARRVELVPIASVSVLNPRSRNKKQHREIIENIDTIGLKRPLTARRVPSQQGEDRYEVVCGEGRLEAFRQLGQEHVPVVIVDGTEEDCLIMSLVENVARRSHRPIDLIQEVGSLRARGYTDLEIAKKIGCTDSWVNMIGVLIEKGEQRLVAAVESNLIPISFAVDIARASDSEVQRVLTEAYAEGRIRGKRVGAIRRMLDQRSRRSKTIPTPTNGRNQPRRKLTTDEMMRLYKRETEKHRILIKKADFAQDRLLFVVEALKGLLKDENFLNVLKAEGLDTLPRGLDDRIAGRTDA